MPVGELMPDHGLVIVPEEAGVKIAGIPTREPAFGLPAVWIPEKETENVQAKGIVVVDPATVVTTHITEIVKSHVDELLGRQEVQAIVDSLAQSYPKIVEDLVPKVIPLGTLAEGVAASAEGKGLHSRYAADYRDTGRLSADDEERRYLDRLCQTGACPNHHPAVSGSGSYHQCHHGFSGNRRHHQPVRSAYGI